MAKDCSKEVIAPVGGQAVMEGVMMRGTNGMALAVRDPEGAIRVETYKLAGAKWYKKVPLLRGVAAFGSSLVMGVRMLTRSTEISSPEEESVGKVGMAIAMAIGFLFAIGLFIVLPELLSGLIRDNLLMGLDTAMRVLIHSVTGGVIRIILFVLYLLFCSKMGDIRRTFMYHGAEHKTINCYEKGLPLNIENIQGCSTVHRRCGTTFLFLVMMISILLFALANWLFEVAGISIPNNKILQNLIRMAIKLALLPIVAGVAFEVLRLFARLPYNLFTKILMAPGLALQKLTTSQPDDDMVEVALKSFNAAMEFESNPNTAEIKYPDTRYVDVRDFIKTKLDKIGAENAEIDWIMCHITGLSRTSLHQIDIVKEEDFNAIKGIVARRLEGEPLDYIIGYSEFFGIKLEVTKDVLLPRMDTETLAERAINLIKKINAGTVLELCTGSGCIARAIADNTNARVTASDISDAALEVAGRNLEGTDCVLIRSDLFESITQKFDVIVANPPYIRSGEIDGLAKEVSCQPRIALDGGEDGLDFYRRIIEAAPRHLNKNGAILFEIGHDQAADVTELLKASFDKIEVVKDLSGSDRVVIATL